MDTVPFFVVAGVAAVAFLVGYAWRPRPPVDASMENRVRLSAEWLDRRFKSPRVWARAIDTERLDMLASNRCILGQLFGSFSVGLAEVPYDLMCRKPGHAFITHQLVTPERLHALWLAEITKRRES